MSDRPRFSEVADLCLWIAPDLPRKHATELHHLLLGMEPAGSLATRIAWLAQLATWLKRPLECPLPARASVSGRSAGASLWLLTEVLNEAPPWRHALCRLVNAVLADTSGVRLFSDTGLPATQQFLSEGVDRIARKLLPIAQDDADLAQVVERVFASYADADWLDDLPPGLLDAFSRALFADEPEDAPRWAPIREAMADAVRLLAGRASALGLEPDVRIRAGGTVRESPFLVLPATCERLLEHVATDDAERRFAVRQWRALHADCHASIRRVTQHLEEFGVSVDLVFRLERIGHQLDRIEFLVAVLCPDPDDVPAGPTVRLLSDLVRDSMDDRSLRALLRTNVRQLSRKIIERAGETGEHYITSSAAEYGQMIRSASGGGALTAGTTVVKYVGETITLPYFFEGAFASMNYAGSFLLMQGLGFTLATKQPSVTAATLAGAIQSSRGERDVAELVDHIARTTRSQLAAVVGNLGLVVPTALAINLAWIAVTGHHFFTEKIANYVVHSLHPTQSGTLFYAALTGVILWLSSMAAGWLENWTVFRRMPEAIARHRFLRNVVGPARAAQLSRFFVHNISGFGGNVSLGLMLGMLPILGKFFGLPLAVRHVTLSTGALAFAGAALGPLVLERDFLAAIVGIGCIGLLNFGVSFACALAVAVRAREVSGSEIARLIRALLVAMLRTPLQFVLPPRREVVAVASTTMAPETK